MNLEIDTEEIDIEEMMIKENIEIPMNANMDLLVGQKKKDERD